MPLPPPTPIFFFFNDTATTEIYTLSLHDALPIYAHRSELTRRNIGTCAVSRGPYIDVTRLGGKGRDLVSPLRLQDGSERKFRGGRRRKQGLRRPAIREQALRLGYIGPVACPIHVDAVPRRAVRKVGPRPDLTRSTHIGEPSGPARLLGDGSRSSCSPYRATHQSTGGGRMKNGGSNPPAPGNRCAGPPGGLSCRPRGVVFFIPPCRCPPLFLPPPPRSAPGRTAPTNPTTRPSGARLGGGPPRVEGPPRPSVT